MNTQRMRALAAGLLLIGSLFGGPVCAQTTAGRDDATLNFVNADIESVIRAMGPLTGKTFLIDPKVQGTLSVVSGGPVDKRLIYPILLSALRSQGFTAIETSGVVRIAPEAEAKHNFSPNFETGMSGERTATAVFKLKNQSATQIVQAIRPMVPPNQAVTAFAGSNSIVVTDSAENLKRIQHIIDTLDVPGRGETSIVTLRQGNATDVAAAVTRLLASDTKADTPSAIVILAEPSNNSVLVRAESTAAQERAVALVRQLDDTLNPDNTIQVVRLRNADAVQLAATLRGIVTGVTPAAAVASPSSTTSAVPGAASATSAAAPATPGGTSIQSDAATNSLIITASPPVFRTLRAVIDKLDARRAQVFVEALIAEVSSDRSNEFGIQWQDVSGAGKSSTQIIGGTKLSGGGVGGNIVDASSNFGTVGRGLSIGVVKGTVTVPGVGEILNLGFLARALETEANANILSTPNLLTLDNEEARIVIGQNVPILTGQFSQTGGTVSNPFQTFERRDVGISLKVRPQISESGAIRLFISQEVSSIATESNTAGQVFNKRSIDSTVLVDDGKIVVLGGLLKDDASITEDKVPVLGDLPGIGVLFRYDKKTRTKTNLMVFLRPTVLRDEAASSAVTQSRMNQIRDAQQTPAAQPGPVLP